MSKGYPTTGEGVKRISEASTRVWNRNEELENLQLIMEEMANQPKEPLGRRQPGERCMYEIQRKERNEHL